MINPMALSSGLTENTMPQEQHPVPKVMGWASIRFLRQKKKKSNTINNKI